MAKNEAVAQRKSGPVQRKAVTAKLEIPERPHMPDAVGSWLEAQLRESKCFLEYGSGGSTRLAAALSVPRIVTVESDRAYANAVQAALDKSETKSRCAILYTNVGKTQDWGFPLNHEEFRRWPNYALGPWDFMRKERTSPDLILIDGRFRVGCFLASLMEARPGTKILFDDYKDRQELYGSVEKFLPPSEVINRSAIFVVPETIQRLAVARALARFINIPE